MPNSNHHLLVSHTHTHLTHLNHTPHSTIQTLTHHHLAHLTATPHPLPVPIHLSPNHSIPPPPSPSLPSTTAVHSPHDSVVSWRGAVDLFSTAMLWLDDPTTDDEGRQPTLPSPHSTAATITFSPPPQWRVAQRERRRDKQRGVWPLRTSQSAFSLTSIAIDAAGSSSSSLTPSLLRPSTPGHASSSSLSSSSSSGFTTASRSVGRVKYTKAIAHLSLRQAINMDTTSGPDSSPSTTPAHLCNTAGCLACSVLTDTVMPSPCGAVWPSDADCDMDGLMLPAAAQLRPTSSYHASVNSTKPTLFINTADHVISMPDCLSQHTETAPMLPLAEQSPVAVVPAMRWWQRLNVPRLVVGVQCVLSVLLLAAATYFTPAITHTNNLLPAYLLPAALFLLCVHTLSQSTHSSPSSATNTRTTTRFITLSSVLSLGLLFYSLYCLFSPAPVLGQPYQYETLAQMSQSLRSFVSLALLYFLSSIALCCLLLPLLRTPAGTALHRSLISPGRGKGASMRRLPSESTLEQFYMERKVARAERHKRKLQSPASFLQRSISDGSSGVASGRDGAHRALLKSCVSMPCMQRVQ